MPTLDTDHERSAVSNSGINIPIDIGPALLLLTHGPFIGLILAGLTISFIFFVTGDDTRVQPARLFSAVTCAWTLLMTLWTLYAIEQTYKENLKVRHPTYGLFGFLSLSFLVALLGALDIWLFVIVVSVK